VLNEITIGKKEYTFIKVIKKLGKKQILRDPQTFSERIIFGEGSRGAHHKTRSKKKTFKTLKNQIF